VVVKRAEEEKGSLHGGCSFYSRQSGGGGKAVGVAKQWQLRSDHGRHGWRRCSDRAADGWALEVSDFFSIYPNPA
jgi:hypothetical protein